jgi:hypothetical protein
MEIRGIQLSMTDSQKRMAQSVAMEVNKGLKRDKLDIAFDLTNKSQPFC